MRNHRCRALDSGPAKRCCAERRITSRTRICCSSSSLYGSGMRAAAVTRRCWSGAPSPANDGASRGVRRFAAERRL